MPAIKKNKNESWLVHAATKVFTLTAEAFDLPINKIQKTTRVPKIVAMRHTCAFILYEIGFTHWEIADAIRYNHHSSSMHAIKAVNTRRQNNPTFAQLLNGILLETKAFLATSPPQPA